MTKLNFHRILKDIFYNKKKTIFMTLLVIISVSLTALFPLLTQFYIRIVYSSSIKYLIYSTIIVSLIYLLKLFFDIKITKFENKLFIMLASNTQEKLILFFVGKKISFEKMYSFIEKKVDLYVLFVRRVVIGNFKSVIRIIAVLITIFFYDMHLFIYSLFFIPIFIIYLILFKRIFIRNQRKVNGLFQKRKHSKLIPFLQREFKQSFSTEDSELFLKDYRRLSSLIVEKEIRNRNSMVSLNQTLRASITFFRVIYLAYFGYYIITQDIHIAGLIIGLLFITILISAFTNMLESILFYHITKQSVVQIQNKIN